jgi:hypothetical protein
VIIHLVFVGSSVMLALSDRISGESHHAPPQTAGPKPEADVKSKV